MRRGAAAALLAAASLAVVAAVGVGVMRDWDFPDLGLDGLDPFAGESCTAVVGEQRAELEVEQAEHASLISAIAVRRGLPARAASIAIATAYQESDLYNIDFGDRDSLGLFQQRPSQGWGTAEQVMDPVYATNAFYDVLIEITDYRGLEITDAAQRVQRSAFPDAYADHEDDARALASAFTGNSPATFACDLDGDAEDADPALLESGLTARADAIRVEVEEVFGDQALGGFAPEGVSTGHMAGSTHYEGRAVDVFFRPVNAANRQRGWAVAHWLVAQADRLDVQTVIWDGMIWRAGRDDAWRSYDAPDRPGDRAILEHRDHVHVDVFG